MIKTFVLFIALTTLYSVCLAQTKTPVYKSTEQVYYKSKKEQKNKIVKNDIVLIDFANNTVTFKYQKDSTRSFSVKYKEMQRGGVVMNFVIDNNKISNIIYSQKVIAVKYKNDNGTSYNKIELVKE